MGAMTYQHAARAWHVLESREVSRALYARQVGSAPEQVFYSSRIARERSNGANRYSNVLPYDRAVLGADDGGEYVNASVVVAGDKFWVAAQAPLPSNFAAFFRSILHRRASSSPLVAHLPRPRQPEPHAILVQLTGWYERGMPKADDYMPHGAEPRTFPSLAGSVSLTRRSVVAREDLGAQYTELSLSDGQASTTLHHYFYGAWPDHGVPEGQGVRQLANLVREVRTLREEKGCEVWVHCSAGVGRTGTFIMLSSMLDVPLEPVEKEKEWSSPLGPLELADPIAQRVDAIREYRCMLVQTPQQLALLYAMLGS